ncbi:hypothetical protein [Burkholderia glumae]|uniref:hypothetical protein n=1 Tax=Burkholderia glumae TaxID=337 RepID=UPI002150EA5B|nr:hypothetical protein [Burkholderia glumae]
MNCKLGDLAVITQGLARDRIVEVVAPYGDYLNFGFCWFVRAPSPIPAMDVRTGLHVYVTSGWCLDAWLRPISGIPVTDDVEDEVTA